MKDIVQKSQEPQSNVQSGAHDTSSASSLNDGAVTQRKGNASSGLSAYQIAQRKQLEAGIEPEGDAISRFHTLKAESSRGDTIQKQEAGSPGVNKTGMPDNLKSGIENLSGYSMDDVNVHYNSDKPAQLQAHAYAQGTDIHVAPGQEKHLPHEAWHVVQQKQGRVQATVQMKGGSVNDNPALEQEADVKGAEALNAGTVQKKPDNGQESGIESSANSSVIQRRVGFEFEDNSWKAWKEEGGAIRRANRKEELHRGTGYKLEGDDAGERANIEWVTKPFDPTDAGLAELNTTMYEITAKYERLNNYLGRRAPEYVRPRQHQLSHNDVRLTGGRPNGTIKMQATFGSSLEDLPTIMKYFGGNVQGETAGETHNRTNARNMMYGDGAAIAGRIIPTVLGNAPSIAQQTITELQQIAALTPDQQAAMGGNTTKLSGFLSILTMYMKMLQLSVEGPVKYRLPFLGRTNLAAMFAEVPAAQQAVLAHNNAQYLKQTLLAVSNANPMVRIEAGAPFSDDNLTVHSSLIADVGPLAAMSIGTWLEGVTTGTDYLHQVNMDTWLVANGHVADPEGSLESISVINDNLGGTDGGLIVMENRAIKPGLRGDSLTIQEVHRMAYNYLQFFVNIAQNNVGAYPNQAPPAREGGGCCYITTACVTTLGLPDDCDELTTLRAFRDNYILKKEYGKELVGIYYKYSPLIVEAIEQQKNSTEVYHNLYTVINDCVGHIKREEEKMAFKIYIDMVLKLKDLYLNNEEINVPKEYLATILN